MGEHRDGAGMLHPLAAFWGNPCSLLARSWRAANYNQFWGMTLEDGIRHRLGTFRPSPTVMNMNEMHVSAPAWGKLRHAGGYPCLSQ